MPKKYAFAPDYVVPPGATLKETLESQGLSQADLALRTGMAEKTISQIMNGIAPISHETSARLELVTGVPASFWNRRELSYREGLARREEALRLDDQTDWLQEIPVSELVSRGYMEWTAQPAGRMRQALQFFGVSSVSAWRAAWETPAAQFRGGSAVEKRPGYVAAWLRIGELKAQGVDCQVFDAGEFRRALIALRQTTTRPASIWQKSIVEQCAAAGVAVVFAKEIPSAGVSGATRWLTKDKALLQLSLKYKTDDHLWFTFFHEAGHILLHGKKQVFVETGAAEETDEEREADEFARDLLIPRSQAFRLPHLRSKAQIRQFAASIQLASGIVVGRLQRDRLLPHSHCNDLKRRLDWAKQANLS